MQRKRITRRRFNRSVAFATGVALAPAFVRSASLADKLNLAIVGTGGRGGSNAHEVESENIVAICDVNARNLDAAAQRYPQAQKFSDFRRMFDQSSTFD